MNLIIDIEKGMKNAQRDYIQWSNGWSISWSAEYILTVNIAQSLGKLKDEKKIDGIFLEYSVDSFAQEDCGIINKNFGTERFDICVDIDDKQSTIIEVKNTIQHEGGKLESIIKDIERCQYFIENTVLVKDAYICFLIDGRDSKEKLEKKKEKFIKRIKEYDKFKKLKLEEKVSTIYKESNNLYWASIVIRFFKK